MSNETTNRVYAYDPTGGEARWWMGSLAVIKAAGEETQGRYTLVEVTDHEGAETPLHVHHNEDEGFWILEGALTFEVGGKMIKAGPGTFLFGLRDVPHRYRVDQGPAWLLFILSPAGFENFIRDTSEPAPALTMPPLEIAQPSPEDFEQLMPIMQQYGCEILE